MLARKEDGNMKAVGITACSNGLKPETRENNQGLIRFLQTEGRKVLVSPCIYGQANGFSGTGEARAEALMSMFENPEIQDIYDISGGDMANEVLDYLDFSRIRESSAEFWGYSDLTVVMNAIYAKTGKTSVLYQIRNLLDQEWGEVQRRRYLNGKELFTPAVQMARGNSMEGILIGGNIRCFLKLAGTAYFPDPQGKILLLEARSGRVPQMVTYLSQLRSMGVFSKIRGILLGTFCEMEREKCAPDILSLTEQFVGRNMPIARTAEIGHRADSKAIRIGEYIKITR